MTELFADAEIAENRVQDILDIDPSGQAAERASGDAQLFGQQVLAAGEAGPQRPPQGSQCLLQRAAVAFPRYQRRFGPGHEAVSIAGQRRDQGVKALAGRG